MVELTGRYLCNPQKDGITTGHLGKYPKEFEKYENIKLAYPTIRV